MKVTQTTVTIRTRRILSGSNDNQVSEQHYTKSTIEMDIPDEIVLGNNLTYGSNGRLRYGVMDETT